MKDTLNSVKRFGKKTASVALSFVLVIGLMPMTAYAEPTRGASEKSDQVVGLDTDVNLNKALEESIKVDVDEAVDADSLAGKDTRPSEGAEVSAIGEKGETDQSSLAASSTCTLAVEVDGETYGQYVSESSHILFLPSNADLSDLSISVSGPSTLTSTTQGKVSGGSVIGSFENNSKTTLKFKDGFSWEFVVMRSDLDCVSVSLSGTSIDAINSGSKDTKYKGNQVSLIEADGFLSTLSVAEVSLTDTLAESVDGEEEVIGFEGESELSAIDNVEIKGRGNYTWRLAKKPYQIKFDSKKSVFGMAAAKKWVLLANYTDNSMMRNTLAFDVASAMSLEGAVDYRHVDLFVDGEYLGNYLICEKVEVGANRVKLGNDDGLLVELDNLYGSEELSFRSKTSGTWFALKESVSDDVGKPGSVAQAAFGSFEAYLNEFERLLYSDDKKWNAISSMIDVESFAKMFLLQEFSEDPDGFRSSFFLYKDGEGDVIHCGPAWDYDVAFGNYETVEYGGNPEVAYVENIASYRPGSNDWYAQLMQIPEFVQAVRGVYEGVVGAAVNDAVRSVSAKQSMLTQSAAMNFTRWGTQGAASVFGGHKNKDTYAEEVAYLYGWVSRRATYLECFSSAPTVVSCSAHVQDVGWQVARSGGGVSGTSGKALRLEAIKVNVSSPWRGSVRYRTHVQNIGWQDWVEGGKMAGTSGQALHLEAIQLELTGELAERFDVYYRVHAQNVGWMGWAKNGTIAGTIGICYRLEAVQVVLVPKGETVADVMAGVESVDSHPSIDCSGEGLWKTDAASYSVVAHIQDYGDRFFGSAVNNGVLGTTGRSKRLEALALTSTTEGLSFSYRTHVQDIGWQEWCKDGTIAGTSGMSRRLEAIQIELEGEKASKYDVYYRAHVQNIGWTGWTKNGERCGSAGYSYRMEAVQIVVIPKDSAAPGEIGKAFYKPSIDRSVIVVRLAREVVVTIEGDIRS